MSHESMWSKLYNKLFFSFSRNVIFQPGISKHKIPKRGQKKENYTNLNYAKFKNSY